MARKKVVVGASLRGSRSSQRRLWAPTASDLSLGPAGMEAAAAEGRGGAPRVPDPPLRPRALPDQRLLSPQQRPLRVAKILQQTCDAAAEVGAAAVIVHAGTPRTGSRRSVGRWPRTLEMLESSVPILIENTAGGENAVARRFDALARLWEAVSKSNSGIETGFCFDTCRARRRGGARRRHRAGGGDRRQDRSASRERLARSTGNRSGPSREPRGRDRRGRRSAR